MRLSVVISRVAAIVSLLFFASFSASSPVSADGYCRGIRLAGRVRVVTSHEDFRVRVVTSHEDLRVRQVERTGPSSSFGVGEWRMVESHEDFSIRYVESHEDFSIRYVESHEGVR